MPLKKRLQTFAKRLSVLALVVIMFLTVGTNTAAATQVQSPNVDLAQLRTGPILMVTDYTVIEGDRSLGSSFVLQMSITNLSEYASAYDVVTTLTIENTSVSLQEGVTNQRYFREIPPLGTAFVQFPMEVYSYCADENMILSMTMSCHDDVPVHYDFQTMMTPYIDVDRTLNVVSVAVPQFVHQNSSMMISATLNNVEAVTLNNIRMHVVTQYGEEITEVGQLLREESKTIDCIYRFPEEKTEDVEVYFTYESLHGQEYSTEPQFFQVVVYGQNAEETLVSSDSLSGGARILIPAIVALLIGFGGFGATLYYVLWKKKGV